MSSRIWRGEAIVLHCLIVFDTLPDRSAGKLTERRDVDRHRRRRRHLLLAPGARESQPEHVNVWEASQHVFVAWQNLLKQSVNVQQTHMGRSMEGRGSNGVDSGRLAGHVEETGLVFLVHKSLQLHLVAQRGVNNIKHGDA